MPDVTRCEQMWSIKIILNNANQHIEPTISVWAALTGQTQIWSPSQSQPALPVAQSSPLSHRLVLGESLRSPGKAGKAEKGRESVGRVSRCELAGAGLAS